jgi:hypothetical protein
MNKFKILYYFSSSEVTVLETKRLDLPASSPMGDIYKWLLVDSETGQVSELHFKSMNQSELEEQRIFLEGEFHFNQAEGRLRYLNKDYQLVRQHQDSVPESMTRLIMDYLN